jgi:multiple sugar transport system ATP-binding protein
VAGVAFNGVGKVYPDGTRAVLDLNLAIEDGEFMVFVGPSGCGKTTALRMVAGLEDISAGEIQIGETIVNSLEPRKRDVAMVFQNYALYPHMTVFENMAFPLRSRRLPRNEVRARVEKTAATLGLTEHLKRTPRTLSGGQRQRVAMGRAIVREPKVFLMDEPLSNLDAKLRVQMRGEISRLQRNVGITTIYVTHDQVEAMTMGSRIAVMRKGVLQQLGPPQELYDRPTNLFVATFIGSPGMNLFQATLRQDGDGLVAAIGEQLMTLPSSITGRYARLADYRGQTVVLGIRPEHLHDPRLQVGGDVGLLRGEVKLVEALGSERLVHLDVLGEPVLTDEVLEIARDIDSSVVQTLQLEAEEFLVPVVARFDARTRAAPGDVTQVAVELEHLHFFELEGGRAIA